MMVVETTLLGYALQIIPLLLLALVLIVPLLLVGALFKKSRPAVVERDNQDAQVMQDIHNGLTRMEKRVESLETILMNRMERESHPTDHELRGMK
jgi:phage shock protein B